MNLVVCRVEIMGWKMTEAGAKKVSGTRASSHGSQIHPKLSTLFFQIPNLQFYDCVETLKYN